MVRNKLTKKKLVEFKEIILDMREKAMSEMGYIKDRSLNDGAYVDSTTRDSTYAYHMADVGTDSQEREKAFLWYTREGKFIRYLDEALDRIKNGSYGFCEECSIEIPEERLKEVPHTKLCVACKNSQNR